MNKGCSICSDPETDENRIVECKKCNVKVHLACYGVIEFSGNSTCSPCDSKKVDPIFALCIHKGGAIKKTVCSKWVHVICALFTEGSTFESKKKKWSQLISPMFQKQSAIKSVYFVQRLLDFVLCVIGDLAKTACT